MTISESAIEIVDRGIITRTHSFPEQKTFLGCVHYPDGRICGRSQRPATGVVWKPIDRRLIGELMPLPYSDADVVYAGHLPNHFGHFLVETPARFWFFSRPHRWERIIFNKFVTGDASDPRDDKVLSLLTAFDIDADRVQILEEDTRFRSVSVPSAIFVPGQPMPASLREVYRRWKTHLLEGHEPHGPGRIYLSRRKIEDERGDCSLNEALLESFFADRQFAIIYPETLSFAEHVRLVAGADVVAGPGGSALHLSAFMRPGARTIVIGTDRWPGPNRVQIACNELSGAALWFYPFSGIRSADPAFRFEIDRCDLQRFLETELGIRTACARP